MNKRQRTMYKDDSNNKDNPNKNWCALYVCKVLQVDENIRYLHTMEDIIRAARTKYTVRSRFSKLGKKNRTVGGARAKLIEIAQQEPECLAFIVGVKGHVLLISHKGNTIIDTDPRIRDKRQITELYIVRTKLDIIEWRKRFAKLPQ